MHAPPGQLDFVGHYTPLEKTSLKDHEDWIRKVKRKMRKLEQRVLDDAMDASDATSEVPTEEDEEEKACRKASSRKKRHLRKDKADAEKENQAQLLLKLAQYRQAEEERRLAREVDETDGATTAVPEAAAAKGHPIVDPCQPTVPLLQACCLRCCRTLDYARGYKVGVQLCPLIGPVTP